ncbi:MAG: hypothetical protein ACR2HJ_08750 [Fimbriimonadales bacterium]
MAEPNSEKRGTEGVILILAMIAMSAVYLNAFIGFATGEKEFLRALDKTLAERKVEEARITIHDRSEFAQTAMTWSVPIALGLPLVLVPLMVWSFRASAKKKQGDGVITK